MRPIQASVSGRASSINQLKESSRYWANVELMSTLFNRVLLDEGSQFVRFDDPTPVSTLPAVKGDLVDLLPPLSPGDIPRQCEQHIRLIASAVKPLNTDFLTRLFDELLLRAAAYRSGRHPSDFRAYMTLRETLQVVNVAIDRFLLNLQGAVSKNGMRGEVSDFMADMTQLLNLNSKLTHLSTHACFVNTPQLEGSILPEFPSDDAYLSDGEIKDEAVCANYGEVLSEEERFNDREVAPGGAINCAEISSSGGECERDCDHENSDVDAALLLSSRKSLVDPFLTTEEESELEIMRSALRRLAQRARQFLWTLDNSTSNFVDDSGFRQAIRPAPWAARLVRDGGLKYLRETLTLTSGSGLITSRERLQGLAFALNRPDLIKFLYGSSSDASSTSTEYEYNTQPMWIGGGVICDLANARVFVFAHDEVDKIDKSFINPLKWSRRGSRAIAPVVLYAGVIKDWGHDAISIDMPPKAIRILRRHSLKKFKSARRTRLIQNSLLRTVTNQKEKRKYSASEPEGPQAKKQAKPQRGVRDSTWPAVWTTALQRMVMKKAKVPIDYREAGLEIVRASMRPAKVSPTPQLNMASIEPYRNPENVDKLPQLVEQLASNFADFRDIDFVSNCLDFAVNSSRACCEGDTDTLNVSRQIVKRLRSIIDSYLVSLRGDLALTSTSAASIRDKQFFLAKTARMLNLDTMTWLINPIELETETGALCQHHVLAALTKLKTTLKAVSSYMQLRRYQADWCLPRSLTKCLRTSKWARTIIAATPLELIDLGLAFTSNRGEFATRRRVCKFADAVQNVRLQKWLLLREPVLSNHLWVGGGLVCDSKSREVFIDNEELASTIVQAIHNAQEILEADDVHIDSLVLLYAEAIVDVRHCTAHANMTPKVIQVIREDFSRRLAAHREACQNTDTQRTS